MNKERKVTVFLNLSDFDQDILKHSEEVYKAIGYLIQWGMHEGLKHDELTISTRDNGHEILAIYGVSTLLQGGRFTMGAIWRGRENKYTFHS